MSESMFKSPPVVPFVECPNCKQLLEYGAEKCPRCREEIDADYALLSAVIVHHNTQAVSLANTIKTAEPAAIINIAVSIYVYFLGIPAIFSLSVLMPVLSLLVILIWFFRFGRFKIGDEDYLKAKRDMRSSFKLWLGLLIVQLLVLFYMLKTATPARRCCINRGE
jgi:RNA polymerase subunit RPABC4/transcription elongation factor Spt4